MDHLGNFSTTARCVLGQIYGAELTAGHSELEYWAYFSTFWDVNFYT
jgi:hypothetical protein